MNKLVGAVIKLIVVPIVIQVIETLLEKLKTGELDFDKILNEVKR